MTIASAVPTIMLGGVAILVVAALTVKVELTAKKLEGVKPSLVRQGGGSAAPMVRTTADNAWLSRIVRSFDD